MFPCSCSLYGSVECQEVGLKGNAVNNLDNAYDIIATFIDFLHGVIYLSDGLITSLGGQIAGGC